MHRKVLSAKEGETVDHINRDKLDNRKENLRIASYAQNNYNKGIERNKDVLYKGVSRTKSGKYRASIMNKGKTYSLGTYVKPSDAAKAYNIKAAEFFGDYAYLNPVNHKGFELNIKQTARTSKYVGVGKAGIDKWRVRIKNPMTDKVENLGTYSTEQEAAYVYNEASYIYYGIEGSFNKIRSD